MKVNRRMLDRSRQQGLWTQIHPCAPACGTSALSCAALARLRAASNAALVRVALTLCVAAAIFATSATAASAALVHPYLSSFGSFSSTVRGVAIDQSSGDVYVYDSTAKAIFKYEADGSPAEFTSTKTSEITGLPAGSAIGRSELAVDNSAGPAHGDIYLAYGNATNLLIYDEEGTKVGELTSEAGVPWGTSCGVAVDREGNVYVGIYGLTGEVNKYTPAANPVTDKDYVSSIGGVRNACNIATDAEGNIFSVTVTTGPVTRYEAGEFGTSLAAGSVMDEAGTTLAVDPANSEVYVDEQSQVSHFGPHGKPYKEPVVVFAQAGEGAISGSQGIAVNASSGEVYVSNGKGAVNVFGPAVLLPTVSTGRASNLTAQTATVSGEVNPEGLPLQECYVEYGETVSYGQRASCVQTPLEIGAGKAAVKVQGALSGLTAGVAYHYRLVASNANGPARATDATFEFVPPAIEDEYSSDVTASSATVDASLNPKGSITEYWFEYGPTEAYGSSTPKVITSEGTSFEPLQAHLQELAEETTYHYRLVASSNAGPTQGPDQAFTTQGPGGPLTLLDGRHWELVSPPMKYGAGILPQRREGSVIRASESGDAITYIAANPIEAEPEGNSAPEASQIMARRAAGGGWANRTLDTANEDIHQLPVGKGLEYEMFSDDLSRSVVWPSSATPLSPSATSQRTPYLREEATCQEGSPSCFTPFLNRQDTMPGAEWDPLAPGAVPIGSQPVLLRGSTDDLSHTVISSPVQLLEEAGGTVVYGFGKEGLYEWSVDGRLQFVSVDAAGEPVAGALAEPRHTISSDGSRVIWCEGRCEGGHSLLMRDTATEETLPIATVARPVTVYPVTFEAANAADSKIFYAVEPTSGEQQLWECDVIEGAGGKLECAATEIAPRMVGLAIGINEAASTIYFVSTAALEGEAHAGADNLYVANLEGEEWEPRFIAALSSEDLHDWGAIATTGLDFLTMTARVAPDGRYLAFMSNRSLTGYDNRDAVSGVPDQEVFLYDDQTGKLVCASCDPTGARPEGKYLSFSDGALVNSQSIWRANWVAATVPGWDNIGLKEAHQQFRYLSDEGRLFFDSSASLVPQDSNGQEDVYEYEPGGVGGCTREGGCVDLVSSGNSGEEAAFLEASASGDDVFFITTAQLTSQDTDTAFDLYDARICSAQAPCSQAPVSPPPCSSGESCKPAQSPQPSIYGAPASATFSGAGNVTPKSPASRGKQHKQVKHKRRSRRAQRQCRHDSRGGGGHKRKRCVRKARRSSVRHQASRDNGRGR